MRVRFAVLTVGGVLLLAASVAHFFGWHQFDAALAGVDLPIAAGLILFGAGALYCRDFNPHFWGFVGLGVLVGAPLIGPQSGTKPPN